MFLRLARNLVSASTSAGPYWNVAIDFFAVGKKRAKIQNASLDIEIQHISVFRTSRDSTAGHAHSVACWIFVRDSSHEEVLCLDIKRRILILSSLLSHREDIHCKILLGRQRAVLRPIQPFGRCVTICVHHCLRNVHSSVHRIPVNAKYASNGSWYLSTKLNSLIVAENPLKWNELISGVQTFAVWARSASTNVCCIPCTVVPFVASSFRVQMLRLFSRRTRNTAFSIHAHDHTARTTIGHKFVE